MDTRNVIAAISLSAAVIILYSLYFAPPPITKDQLAEKNKHPRDEKIGFIEETHTYTIGNRSDFTSVTTFIHQHFPHFDSDAVIKNIMKNPEKKQAKYGDMTGDEIKAMWKKSGDDACALGDYMHKSIELFYNGIQYDNPTIEFQYFKNFQREHEAMGLKPYRTEWKVYDEELELAGAGHAVERRLRTVEAMV